MRHTGIPEQVQQADARDRRQESHQQHEREVAEPPAMRRRAVVVVLAAVAVFGAGCYGTWSYALNYYLYRGFPVVHDPPGITRGREVILKIHSKALHADREVL